MDPLLEQFLLEARENLSFIDQNIEEIGSDDPELLNSVFRAAHTLKGGSGIVGFESVKNITHHAEDLLDMLRGGKIEFQPSMLEALYDAFDEVMNLIEAAEESESIVDADEERVESIIAKLNEQMGKDNQTQQSWEVPFTFIDDVKNVVNMPLEFLKDFTQVLPFKHDGYSEEDCEKRHLFAITFDIDESCMVYGNDPIYTLSLLGDEVIGIHTCMSEQSAKSILSGMDDPEGLLLQTQITAFVYGVFSDIEDALFNFLDELQFAVLDISTLLGIDRGDAGHQLDVIKELTGNIQMSHDSISEAVNKALALVGEDTIQYAQLRRLLDVLTNISEKDLVKLNGFFKAMENAEVYSYSGDDAEFDSLAEDDIKHSSSVADSEPLVEVDEVMQENIDEVLTQQLKVLDSTAPQEDSLKRVLAILDLVRRFYPDMPQMSTKSEIREWISNKLGIEVESKESDEQDDISAEDMAEMEREVLQEVKQEKSTLPNIPKKPAPKKEKAVASKAVVGKTVKIEQESIDNLMNIVGELLVAKNSLPYLADNVVDMNTEMIKREIMEKYTFINRLSEQLQDLIMSMRMLPISYVFDRYPKLVREISKNLGKKVKLTMEGGNTKLDKNMIEMLADPMIHIMRNSLDHGIETPEVRLKKGKSEEGLVSLEAYSQSDKIVIEIVDDGAGINVDRVIQKVLEKELLTIDQIDMMSDNEKAELVMLPGLSTAEEISEYSGRGVGMDVVRKSIESFGGTISIETRPNQGTTIRLSIPVSLAVSELLHVTMNGVHYGLPMDNVSEIVKIDRSNIEYLHNEPFIYIRGEVIPLLFIKTMLDEEALLNQPLPIVVLTIKENLVAIVVNELLGQLDVVQKPLEGVMENHPIFSGTALLGNGQIIMTIDPLGILSISNQLKSSIEKVG
jgi:two-component system chemotaxis sensor kinase CheA